MQLRRHQPHRRAKQRPDSKTQRKFGRAKAQSRFRAPHAPSPHTALSTAQESVIAWDRPSVFSGLSLSVKWQTTKTDRPPHASFNHGGILKKNEISARPAHAPACRRSVRSQARAETENS